MLMVADPPLRVAAAELKLPLVKVTDPVGVGLPLPPLTTTDTESDWAAEMLEEEVVTVKVGVASAPASVTCTS
jgi:hypothetical protein